MPNIETNTLPSQTTELREPGLFKVIILNDDTTPVEFVIALLISIFGYSENQATDLTYQIHHDGSAVAGTYIYEIAEQKGIEVTELSRAHGFPLQVKVKAE